MYNEIGLGEFIAKIKEELEPTEDSPVFFLEKVELEIHVTASQEGTVEGGAEGEAGLKVNVLGFDVMNLGGVTLRGTASGKLQRQDVHTIKVCLTPIFTKEEIKASLSDEKLKELKNSSMPKIMRGEKEEDKLSLSEEKPQKRMRG